MAFINAKLKAAAAPEMLEALTGFVLLYRGMSLLEIRMKYGEEVEVQVERGRAAIAKESEANTGKGG